jgi:hypothetical protein
MARRIRLVRYEVQNINWQFFGAYRMRVEVPEVEGDDLDPHIFIYQRGLVSPYTGQVQDEFVAIAGPAQMADIPVGEPDANRYYPYYRLNYIEQDFTSEELAMEVWRTIQREAAVLCEAMGRFTQLTAVEDVWLPTVPTTGNSQSASASQ